jgi:signal transduction histidine kinase/HAMP domain-containing protein
MTMELGISRLSIRGRLILLAVSLLAILMLAVAYLTEELASDSVVLGTQARVAEELKIAGQAERHFGDFKYWLEEFAVSLLDESQERAATAQREFEGDLKALSIIDAAGVGRIKAELAELQRLSLEAAEAYGNNQRTTGNALMAKSRDHVQKVDQELSIIVYKLERRATAARDAAIGSASAAVKVAIVTGLVAIFLAVVLLVLILRSIVQPLRRLERAMVSISRGQLQQSVATTGNDEICAMSRALETFRLSLLDRERLERERADAEARAARARLQLEEAIGSIDEGFVLWDTEDRLIICNERLRKMFGELDIEVRQGVNFEEVARSLARSGNVPLPPNEIKDWVQRRVASHRECGAPFEHQNIAGRWLRISETRTRDGTIAGVYMDITSLKAREHELAASLEELRTTQDRLVQTEKLASLGQLTAGIAHEIKNPLNFVNNFSAVSIELAEELRQALAAANLDVGLRTEIGEIADMLQGNLDKVLQHGRRADSIVKNMLQHSRQSSGERGPVDINALVEESLNLAYHGARAEKQGFNITLERSLDPTAGEVDVFAQEVTRVLLNLITNGFYAATKRKRTASDGYEPTLAAATKNLGDRVEIRIRDNGTGIPPEVKDKIFNPFFTTKPAGEGTGLGLSISHDIIVKQHGGSIEVDTQPGEFTEIRVILPRGSVDHS